MRKKKLENIFWRPKTKGNKTQKENDVTKSFLCLLKRTHNRLTKRLFNEFSIYPQEDSSFSYEFQKELGNIEKESSIFLRGLHHGSFREEEESDKEGGIPDATIKAEPGDKTLVLEVKTEGFPLKEEQMKRYKRNLEITEYDFKNDNRDWIEIYEILEEELEKDYLGKIDNFLVRQFLEYLDLVEMSPFQKFDEDSEKYIENYDWKNFKKFLKDCEDLLKNIRTELSKKDWYKNNEWATSIKKHAPKDKPREKRLRILKNGWKHGKREIRYRFQIGPKTVSNGELIFCLFLSGKFDYSSYGYENYKEFAERLRKEIDEESVKEKFPFEECEIKEKENFLTCKIPIELYKGKEIVENATKVISKIVEETHLTEKIDEMLNK